MEFGAGDTKVICPITDYFVAHHGALGGFVRIWCRGEATADDIISVIQTLDGIESVLDKNTVCALYDLPPDREGDVAVIARANVCIGAAEADHDLSGLQGFRLRSHGALSEAKVPFILSEPLNDQYRLKAGATTLKSYQIFEFAINGAVDCLTTRHDGTRKNRRLRAPNGPFEVREFPLRPPRADEILVKVRMSTICRSDIHSYQGHRPNPCPGVLGHEIIGTIVELGTNVNTGPARRGFSHRRSHHLE